MTPELPQQAQETPWPTRQWPRGHLEAPQSDRLETLMAEAWGAGRRPELGETHALLVVQRGRLVFDHYGDGFTCEQTHASWSMAKSITHALVGIIAGGGGLDIHAPADAPEWRSPGDDRATITLDQLLRMSSGLAFVEEYAPGKPSDTIEMLYGSGKADTASFAASKPLAHSPGTVFSYSSGTTNIVSRCAARAIQAGGAEFERFMHERLFAPLGMTSATPKFDQAGTFIGSSYCFCTAEDFARFGLLYLRDGVWEGRRLLPRGWVDHARSLTPQSTASPDGPYGAHWWLGHGGPGSFAAIGFESQATVVVPDLDLIVVRLGKTPLEHKAAFKAWLGEFIDCFRPAS